MSDWKRCTLADLGEIVGGATPSTKNESYYGGDIAWITPKDLSTFQGRFIRRGERNITADGLKNSSARLMPPHSVLFTSRAPIGYVAIAENKVCTNQGFKSIVPNSYTDYLFLYYLLVYNRDRIENMGSGTTFKEVSGSVMKQIEVFVPNNKAEQRAIADTLGALDDKIENNSKINHHLEQMAQAIFKSWFVDFEPWRGVMPDDWREGTLSEVISTTLGGDWGKDTPTGNNTQEVYCIRGADIPNVNVGNKGKMPIRFILPKNYASKRLAVGDIVVEISGGSPTQSTGRCALITQSLLDRYDRGMVCTNFCRAVKPLDGYSAFVYFYCKYLYDQSVMFSYENGTTGIKNLDITGLLENEPIIIPPKHIADQFTESVGTFIDTIFANGLENEGLAATRDTLLPRLMSGELSVADLGDAK